MRAAGAAKMVFCVTSAAAGAAKNHSLQLGSAAITAWRLGGEHVVTWSVSFDDSRFSKSVSCTAAVLAVRTGAVLAYLPFAPEHLINPGSTEV